MPNLSNVDLAFISLRPNKTPFPLNNPTIPYQSSIYNSGQPSMVETSQNRLKALSDAEVKAALDKFKRKAESLDNPTNYRDGKPNNQLNSTRSEVVRYTKEAERRNLV
jgi:hypothetical protein